MRRLGDLSPEQRAALEHFSRSLMNKFLHEPSVRLRAAAANGRGLAVVDAARYLFGLEGLVREEQASEGHVSDALSVDDRTTPDAAQRAALPAAPTSAPAAVARTTEDAP
jgi:glutamyl-tRNA reductase